jgi:hypothetical protein
MTLPRIPIMELPKVLPIEKHISPTGTVVVRLMDVGHHDASLLMAEGTGNNLNQALESLRENLSKWVEFDDPSLLIFKVAGVF